MNMKFNIHLIRIKRHKIEVNIRKTKVISKKFQEIKMHFLGDLDAIVSS